MSNQTGFDYDVLISRLHGGLLAFQSLRAHRRQRDQPPASPPEERPTPPPARTSQPHHDEPAEARAVSSLEPQAFIAVNGRVVPLFGDLGAGMFDSASSGGRMPPASSDPPPAPPRPNHTSGTWAAAVSLIAVVLRGQAANPVGGYAFGSSGGTSSVTAPSITLGDSSGASRMLHFLTAYGGFTARDWSSAPSEYTARTSITVPGYGFGCRLLTKDTTTSDGTATNSLSGSVTNTYAASLEIKGTKASAFLAMF